MEHNARGRIILIDDDPAVARALYRFLGRVGFRVDMANSGEEGLEKLIKHSFDVALVDWMMPGMSGLDLLKKVREMNLSTQVIIMTGQPSVERIMEAVGAGAFHFVEKPLPDPEKIQILIERAVEAVLLRRQNEELKRRVDEQTIHDGLVGNSPCMVSLRAEIRNFAAYDWPVLILGESGVGKELVAEAIYRHSKRRDKPYIPLLSTTLKSEFFESHVYGHVKGAFTGAHQDKKGILETYDKGTIFIDEVGDLPLDVQGKFLRLLDKGEFNRMGELETVRKADVRIICATNVDLEQAVAAGKFRRDLHQRLNVLTLRVPPLRERLEDVPQIAYHVLKLEEQKGRLNKPIQISPEAIEVMQQCAWSSGNVRQLFNAVRYALTRAVDGTIHPEHLPDDIRADRVKTPVRRSGTQPYSAALTRRTYRSAKKVAEIDFARWYFSALLSRHKGVVNRAAEDAGMEPTNLRKKLKEINLSADEFREKKSHSAKRSSPSPPNEGEPSSLNG